VQSVGPSSDFFGLGGDSLAAIRCISRIREGLGLAVNLRTFLAARSPEALAQAVMPLADAAYEQAASEASGQEGLLSHIQQRLWLLQQADPESAAQHVAESYVLDGPLDVRALQAAFDALHMRHGILSSNYPRVDGGPLLRLSRQRFVALGRVDLRYSEAPMAEARVRARLLAQQPFDVAKDPLLRVALYRLADAQHLLALCVHPLIADHWTLGLLLSELLAHYAAVVRAEAPPAAPAALAHTDYAAAQRARLSEARLAPLQQRAQQQLAGAPPLELPCDFPRSEASPSAGASETFSLPAELWQALRRRAQTDKATVAILMLAAFEVLLYRYSGQQDLVLGVTVANRTTRAVEGVVGPLASTLAFRMALTPDLTVAQWVGRVRDAALEAFDLPDLPFAQLAQALGSERGRGPLLQVRFDYQNAPMPAPDVAGLCLRHLQGESGAAPNDLTLRVADSALGRELAFVYRTGLYRPETVRRMAGHFQQILHAFAASPDCTLDRIALLDSREREQVLQASRAEARVQPAYAPVHQLFEARVRTQPDAEAVSDADQRLTYAALDARASRLASQLRLRGVVPGARVAVFLGRSVDVLVALLGVLKVGGTYVPLDPLYPAERLAWVLADAEPALVITDAALHAELAPDTAARALVLGAERAEGPDLPSHCTPPSTVAYILYTSGSTGKPKGVPVSMGALVNFLVAMAHCPGMDRQSVLLSVTTIAFDIAGLELFLPIVTGGRVHIASATEVTDGRALRAMVDRLRPTHMQATPASWKLLLAAGFEGSPDLTVLCGGEAFPRDLGDALLSRARAVWNLYGPTENTIWSSIARVTPGTGMLPIGVPIDRTQIYVLDPRAQLVPFGVPGELYIGGAGVAEGYLGRPELTAERFLPDPHATEAGARMYRTGDRGVLSADGLFYCLGRLDHQIKIRGFRVEPGEIEQAIKSQPGVRDAVVVVREDRPGDMRLVGYVEATAEGYAEQVLRGALQMNLPDYMVPSALVRLDALPQTPNGKIDRKALPAPASAAAPASSRVAPRDVFEVRLAALWEEVLGLKDPSVHDSFFALGGHSLLAVRLLDMVEREMGVSLQLGALLQGPTIAQMARSVEDAGGVARAIVRTAPRPTVAPTGIQHLMLLRPGRMREKHPLFCVHGAGGHVLNLVSIAERLGDERSVYGLAARGVDGVLRPHTDLRAMARDYFAEIRAVSPEGPYFLMGYCGGGLIAYELAQLFRRAGQRVAMLAMVQAYHPSIDVRWWRFAQLAQKLAEVGPRYLLQRGKARLEREVVARVTRALIEQHLREGQSVPLSLRDQWVTSAYFEALARYEPEPSDQPVTMLSGTPDPLLRSVGLDLGWASTITGQIRTRRLPGDHDHLTAPENVGALAEALREAVQTAEAELLPR
jgi:amino acid adenylation domain-containing protein